ncbi:MAG: gas vesicle protein [Planctomycetia bacterium]|nr:gas vesicle protein [Planctomycetia bacterium]
MDCRALTTGEERESLIEVLDRVLHKGVVAGGDVVISVADVDLVYLRLQLLLSSVETARRAGWYTPAASRTGLP